MTLPWNRIIPDLSSLMKKMKGRVHDSALEQDHPRPLVLDEEDEGSVESSLTDDRPIHSNIDDDGSGRGALTSLLVHLQHSFVYSIRNKEVLPPCDARKISLPFIEHRGHS